MNIINDGNNEIEMNNSELSAPLNTTTNTNKNETSTCINIESVKAQENKIVNDLSEFN